MGWLVVLAVTYFIAVYWVVNSENKATRVIILVVWALLGLAIGHFALGVFG